MTLGQGANRALSADRKAVRMAIVQAFMQLCLWWSLMERDLDKAESCDRRRMEEREVVYFQEFRECGFNSLQVKEIYPCG